MTRSPAPVRGRRALDLSTGVGAAYTTKLLADVGWDVVKLEPPGGDPLRERPSRQGGGHGGAFAFVNQGKRSALVRDRTQLDRLAAAADAVVGDFSPSGCRDSGREPAEFHSIQARSCVVSVSPFGLTGPRSRWCASDMVVQAASGLMFLTGEWDQPPQQLAPYQAALTAGVAAASTTLAAVLGGPPEHGPRRLDVSMLEALAAYTHIETSRYVYSGEVARREARIKEALRMVRASDGFVYCSPSATAIARMDGIAVLIEEPRLAEDRFQTAEGRMEHWDEFCALFIPPFARRTAREWFERAEVMHMTFALVQTVDDLFQCPQLCERELFLDVPGPRGQRVSIPGRSFRSEGGPPGSARAAPGKPGEHTEEVLREWLA